MDTADNIHGLNGKIIHCSRQTVQSSEKYVHFVGKYLHFGRINVHFDGNNDFFAWKF